MPANGEQTWGAACLNPHTDSFTTCTCVCWIPSEFTSQADLVKKYVVLDSEHRQKNVYMLVEMLVSCAGMRSGVFPWFMLCSIAIMASGS